MSEQLMLFDEEPELASETTERWKHKPHVCIFPGGCWRCANRTESERTKESDRRDRD